MFHRLEHVCYTIEHGEWSFSRRPPAAFFPPPGGAPLTPTRPDSRSETPSGLTPGNGDSDHSEAELLMHAGQVTGDGGGDQVRRGQGEGGIGCWGRQGLFWLYVCNHGWLLHLPACLYWHTDHYVFLSSCKYLFY